jgi:hypothetical protein
VKEEVGRDCGSQKRSAGLAKEEKSRKSSKSPGKFTKIQRKSQTSSTSYSIKNQFSTNFPLFHFQLTPLPMHD